MKTISKKGQLTLFIIAGIILVVGISGYLFFQQSFAQNKYDPKVSTLKDNLLDCFKNNYETALEISAYQGGYIEKPNKEILEIETVFVPYYYYEGKDIMPPKNIIEAEIGKISQNLISNCIEFYQEDQSFDLSYKDFEVFSKIEEEKVTFKTNMELTVKYDNKTAIIEFTDFEISIDSKLYDMYEVARIIVNQANNDPQEWIDLTEIYEEVDSRDLNASIFALEEDTSTHLFIIETNKPYIYPSKLQFLNKYNLEDIGFPISLDNSQDI